MGSTRPDRPRRPGHGQHDAQDAPSRDAAGPGRALSLPLRRLLAEGRRRRTDVSSSPPRRRRPSGDLRRRRHRRGHPRPRLGLRARPARRFGRPARRDRLGAGQSGRNLGFVRQQGRAAAELPIMMAANQRWRRLSEELGCRPRVADGRQPQADERSGAGRVVTRTGRSKRPTAGSTLVWSAIARSGRSSLPRPATGFSAYSPRATAMPIPSRPARPTSGRCDPAESRS